MIGLFAADLDGTLMNGMHVVDPVILGALRDVREAGAHFAIATGRVMRSNRDFGFEGNVAAISANGALILDEDSRLVRVSVLPEGFAEGFARAFPEAPLEFVTAEHSYHLCSREEHEATFRGGSLVARIVMRGMNGNESAATEHVYDITPGQVSELEVCKINARVLDEGLARQMRAYLAQTDAPVVNTPFNPDMFEISSADATKAEGVAWLAGYLGLAEDEVAVYGDGGNDIAMLARFEHAYATRGACDEAKRAAGPGHTIGSCWLHAVPRHMRCTLRDERR